MKMTRCPQKCRKQRKARIAEAEEEEKK